MGYGNGSNKRQPRLRLFKSMVVLLLGQPGHVEHTEKHVGEWKMESRNHIACLPTACINDTSSTFSQLFELHNLQAYGILTYWYLVVSSKKGKGWISWFRKKEHYMCVCVYIYMIIYVTFIFWKGGCRKKGKVDFTEVQPHSTHLFPGTLAQPPNLGHWKKPSASRFPIDPGWFSFSRSRNKCDRFLAATIQWHQELVSNRSCALFIYHNLSTSHILKSSFVFHPFFSLRWSLESTPPP